MVKHPANPGRGRARHRPKFQVVTRGWRAEPEILAAFVIWWANFLGEVRCESHGRKWFTARSRLPPFRLHRCLLTPYRVQKGRDQGPSQRISAIQEALKYLNRGTHHQVLLAMDLALAPIRLSSHIEDLQHL